MLGSGATFGYVDSKIPTLTGPVAEGYVGIR